MDVRPIGVFDSGLGGLTTVRELMTALPSENIVYFGDTGRVPYGTRSKETILKYARQDIAFLRSFDIKMIIVACGTVSATALPALLAETALPMIGVVEPAALAAAAATRNGRIGLIGTQASVRSGAYETALRAIEPSIAVSAQACPLLVPLVEAGRTAPDDPIVLALVREYLLPICRAGVDTLILGCTHYPLLTEAISSVVGRDVTLINPGAEAARTAASAPGFGRGREGVRGVCRYFVSDDVESFARNAAMYLGRPIEQSAEQVDMDAVW